MPERIIDSREYGRYWKVASGREKNDSPEDIYFGYRVEDAGESSLDLKIAHGESFIRTVIPALISRFKSKKIKILETGGGACFHADQIRAAFPNEVEVFTTGLKKKWALEVRKNPTKYEVPDSVINIIKNFDTKLHKNDLKWRSVLQLNPYPEFHLIIENYGEYYYSKENKFLAASFDKLVPGGELTIYPVYKDDERKPVEYLQSKFPNKFISKVIEENFRVGRGYRCLKIYKV